MNFRNQYGEWKYDTVEEKGHHVSYDLPDKEETIYNIHFLPQCDFLQEHVQNITIRRKKWDGKVKLTNVTKLS